MAREDVAAICRETGMEYAYLVWPAETRPEDIPYPHLRYHRLMTRRIRADDATLALIDRYSIVLVSKAKDDDAEALVEDALAAAGVVASDPVESWLESERLHQVSWEFELVR